MHMKKVKKLLLVLMSSLFVLMVSFALSITHELNWQGIIFFVCVSTIFGILLAVRKPQKLMNANLGWIFSGILFALVATEKLLGVYTKLFETVALAIFAFTIFFICIPNITKSQKQKP